MLARHCMLYNQTLASLTPPTRVLRGTSLHDTCPAGRNVSTFSVPTRSLEKNLLSSFAAGVFARLKALNLLYVY